MTIRYRLREYEPEWPVIAKKKPALPDADAFKGVEGKFEAHFSPNPGSGDA